jgi:hypothetical protein
MIYKNDLIETSRSHLGLGVDIGRAALQPVYIPIEKLSETNLCDWVASALVGHCIQYHEGLLLRDRSETNSDLTTKDRARIHSVARRAWIACELGLVHLFSQKVGEDHYRYLAMRSSSPLKPPKSVPTCVLRRWLPATASPTERKRTHDCRTRRAGRNRPALHE